MAAAGLRLPLHEDVLDRERSLFYAAVSRPEDVLFLSWRSSDEEGDPRAPSAFLDDVRALFTDDLWEQRGTRLLADVTWAPRDAPTPHELRRAYAAAAGAPEPAPLGAPATRRGAGAARRARDRAGTRPGVVRRLRHALARGAAPAARPHRARPRADAARLARSCGAGAHARAAARAHRLRADRAGTARPRARGPPRRARARRRRRGGASRRGPAPARRRALLRGLEADLERYLRTEAECGAGYEPTELEWSFGGADDAHGPLDLGAGGGLVTGRVDRVDIGRGGEAIVRDYKGRSVVGGVKWGDELQLQVALYLLAVRDLLGLEPVAGLYQPLAGRKLGARGLVRDDVPGGYTRTDVVDAGAFDAALQDARALAARTAADLHAGQIEPCPERCSSRGCRYPGICRAGEPRPEAPA